VSSRPDALFRSPHPSGHELKHADLHMLTLSSHKIAKVAVRKPTLVGRAAMRFSSQTPEDLRHSPPWPWRPARPLFGSVRPSVAWISWWSRSL
jgi:hypothetical protein